MPGQLEDLLGRFEWFLKSRKLMPHTEIGDCMRGLRSFLVFASGESRRGRSFNDVRARFANWLSDRQDVSEKQRERALTAVQIYRGQFGGKNGPGHLSSGICHLSSDQESAELGLGTLAEQMQVRRYARRTIKIYLDWCEAYFGYCERVRCSHSH
jgi:hypothetical protein